MTNVTRLPGPISELWDWQRLGLCRGRDSAQFFHPDGERGASRGRREAAAKSVCRACPVRAECAAHALATREPYGVWGGFTEAERMRLLATGWEDLADRSQSRVDVVCLEKRLGVPPNAPVPHLNGRHRTTPVRTPAHVPAPAPPRNPGHVPAPRGRADGPIAVGAPVLMASHTAAAR